ncbi:hypothetical protein WJU23_06510 [Prosthecobacter sp. SYSU 5D2]|uniref:hypothetical protein n=1 Tax=Prosthecobacter sp. SYSU 5D2 TaxID=3134134 RepID=UPI0031FEB87C
MNLPNLLFRMKSLLRNEWMLPLIMASVGMNLPASAMALERESQAYQIVTESINSGGGSGGSADYQQDASFGIVGGLSTAPAGEAGLSMIKHGYIGQLYEEQALEISVSPESVPERTNGQLSVLKRLDDDTFLAVDPETLQWNVMSGPVSAITAEGGFTSQTVFADTTAMVRADVPHMSGEFSFLVTNTDTDDFGIYAGDGLEDAWQVEFFGEENSLGAPHLDPDGDSLSNAHEYLAGTIPKDPASVFRLKVLYPPNSAQPVLQWKSLPGRFYEVQSSSNLLEEDWTSLATVEGIAGDIIWPDPRPVPMARAMYRVIVRY